MKKRKEFSYRALSRLLQLIVLASMVVYQALNQSTKPVYNLKGEKIKEQTMQMKITGSALSTIYSIVVILFGSLYKILAYR